jgi:cytochrome c553
MKTLLLSLLLSLALAGCGERTDKGATSAAPKQPAADSAAGKIIAERDCKGCHGLNGGGLAPAIPHLAAQSEAYLVAALREYKEGKRTHAALRDLTGHMSDADFRNVAAYFAGLPPIASSPGKTAHPELPYERGKSLSAPCSKCHGADGNSTTPGVPSLAGQQPRYFALAIQEYLNGERKKPPMHSMLPGLSKADMDSLALYFASQTPVQRAAASFGNAAEGEPLTAVCGGCHGSHGVSNDAATPNLAGQDPTYLLQAIKAYRTTRKRENMRVYVAGLSDRDIQNIAAFYTQQKSQPAEKGQTIIQDLTEKCNRCHGPEVQNLAMAVPKLNGQDKDYLVMALREYRDDRRESSMMHRMSLPYSDSIIESLASFYASQPVR